MNGNGKGGIALVIGIGNPSRQDDSVGYQLINWLADALGVEPLGEMLEPEDLTPPVSLVWVQQLLPELAEALARCELVVFCDAHTGVYAEEYLQGEVEPEYRTTLVSHHMRPETLLAMARDLYGHCPRAWRVSVRGYDFDFGDELSERTAGLARRALKDILGLVAPRPDQGGA